MASRDAQASIRSETTSERTENGLVENITNADTAIPADQPKSTQPALLVFTAYLHRQNWNIATKDIDNKIDKNIIVESTAGF